MAEFTPGKWEIDTSLDCLLICAPTPEGYKSLVARASSWENARLIIAAPELYELVMDELRGEAGGILSFDRETKIKAVLNYIDGKENNDVPKA